MGDERRAQESSKQRGETFNVSSNIHNVNRAQTKIIIATYFIRITFFAEKKKRRELNIFL